MNVECHQAALFVSGFNTYLVLQDEFFEVYHEMFTDDVDAAALFNRLDQKHTDSIDYVSFIDQIKVSDIPQLTSKCREHGPLKEVGPCVLQIAAVSQDLRRL